MRDDSKEFVRSAVVFMCRVSALQLHYSFCGILGKHSTLF